MSLAVQALPSSQAVPLGSTFPLQTPLWHLSGPVHGFPSLQAVPLDCPWQNGIVVVVVDDVVVVVVKLVVLVVVVEVVGLVVVVEAPAGLKVASTMCQVSV